MAAPLGQVKDERIMWAFQIVTLDQLTCLRITAQAVPVAQEAPATSQAHLSALQAFPTRLQPCLPPSTGQVHSHLRALVLTVTVK